MPAPKINNQRLFYRPCWYSFVWSSGFLFWFCVFLLGMTLSNLSTTNKSTANIVTLIKMQTYNLTIVFAHFTQVLSVSTPSDWQGSRRVNRCSRSGAGLHLRDKNAHSSLWLVLKLAACGLRLRLGQGPGPKLALFLVSM